MTAKIIDGKAFAAGLRDDIATAVAQVKEAHNLTPGLAVIIVGDDPASHVYVRNKKKQTVEAGMASFDFALPESTSQADLIAKVEALNANPEVHGILVQLPLPKHIDEQAVINAIDPAKDVDGFHAVNTGRLVTDQPNTLISCTPLGCMMLLKSELGDDLSGKQAVVIGRSNIVGKPMASLLLNANATVTVCHSRTPNVAELCSKADIVIAAVGRPEMVKGDWIKAGAVVIDVGINRIELPDGKAKLVGDVDTEAASHNAAAITPVPGGVGPMTIACLLRNTLQAACASAAVAFPLDT